MTCLKSPARGLVLAFAALTLFAGLSPASRPAEELVAVARAARAAVPAGGVGGIAY